MTHSRWTLTFSALLLAACGSSNSTSPKGQSAAQVAAYYDALAGTHLAGTTATDTIDAEIIGLFNGPIAYGQLPAKVSVSASGSAQTWFGNAVELTDSAHTDSLIVAFLWADTTVSSFILVEAEDSLPKISEAEFYTRGDDFAEADTLGIALVPGVKSTACATNITITHVFTSFIPTYDPTDFSCTPATFGISGHLHFQPDSTIASQYQDVDLSSSTLSGVRLQLVSGSLFARVRKMPHAILRAR